MTSLGIHQLNMIVVKYAYLYKLNLFYLSSQKIVKTFYLCPNSVSQ